MDTRERDHRRTSPRQSSSQSQCSSIHTIPWSTRGFIRGCGHRITHVHLFGPPPSCVGQIVPSYSDNLLRLPRADEPPTENRNPMWRTSPVKLHGTSVRFGPTSFEVQRQGGWGDRRRTRRARPTRLGEETIAKEGTSGFPLVRSMLRVFHERRGLDALAIGPSMCSQSNVSVNSGG